MSGVNVVLAGFAVARKSFFEAGKTHAEAAFLAVNDAAAFARKLSADEINRQVNFPAGYLGSPDSPVARLKLVKSTRSDNPVARVSARQRAVSLARFATGTLRRGKPVVVRVKRGGSGKEVRGAFRVRLRSGKALTDDNFNEGIAIRLKPGAAVAARRRGNEGLVELGAGSNVFLLYGPSVDQVFSDVRGLVANRTLTRLEAEYLRQRARLEK